MALNHLDISRGHVLNYDSRDIPLPCDQREAVWAWCDQQHIDIEGQIYGVSGMDIWRVRDDKQRVRFVLKWL